MQVRIGTSTRANAVEAVAEAAGAALARSSAPTFALVFATPEYPPEALRDALRNTLGDVPFGGCVTPGILAHRDVMPRGVAVGIFDSASLRVGIGAAGLVSTGARAAGRTDCACSARRHAASPDRPQSCAHLVHRHDDGRRRRSDPRRARGRGCRHHVERRPHHREARAAEAHGGDLTVRSEEGRGTTFVMRLAPAKE